MATTLLAVVSAENIYQTFTRLGGAGFFVKRNSWSHPGTVGKVVSVGGLTSGTLPGDPPYHQPRLEICVFINATSSIYSRLDCLIVLLSWWCASVCRLAGRYRVLPAKHRFRTVIVFHGATVLVRHQTQAGGRGLILWMAGKHVLHQRLPLQRLRDSILEFARSARVSALSPHSGGERAASGGLAADCEAPCVLFWADSETTGECAP
jgi:hypothetical protein